MDFVKDGPMHPNGANQKHENTFDSVFNTIETSTSAV